MIALALVAADAVTTAVGLAGNREEVNPFVAGWPPALIVAVGVLASLAMCRLLAARGWLRWVAMGWLAVKGVVVANNLAVLAH